MTDLVIPDTTKKYQVVAKSYTLDEQKPVVFQYARRKEHIVIRLVGNAAGLPYEVTPEPTATDADKMINLTKHSAPQPELIQDELNHLATLPRQVLVERALRAQGNWQASESQETSVEIVRRLRDEWQ